MRMRKTVNVKLNRQRDPYAASLRMHRAIRFDEKRHALQTLAAWQDLWDWQRMLNDPDDLCEDE